MPRHSVEESKWGVDHGDIDLEKRSVRPPALRLNDHPHSSHSSGADSDDELAGPTDPLVPLRDRSRSDADDSLLSDTETVFGPRSPLPTPLTNPHSHSGLGGHRRKPSRSHRSKRFTLTLSLSHVTGFWRCLSVTVVLLCFLVVVGLVIGAAASRSGPGGWIRRPHPWSSWGDGTGACAVKNESLILGGNSTKGGFDLSSGIGGGKLVHDVPGWRVNRPAIPPRVIAGYDTSKNITTRFRDALLPDEKYITSWGVAGWTNDVVAYVHLIWLGMMTSRIPIVPPFQPSHQGRSAGFIPFGEVYDVPRLSSLINHPVVEWRQLKNFTNPVPPPEDPYFWDYGGGEWEKLGCFSVWMTQMLKGSPPREGSLPSAMRIDVSNTPVPWGHHLPTPDSLEYSLPYLASLGDDTERKTAIDWSLKNWLPKATEDLAKLPKAKWEGEGLPEKVPVPSSHSGHQDVPEDHLLCFDYLFFTLTSENHDLWDSWSPAWRLVGRHLHWSQTVMGRARQLLAAKFASYPSTHPIHNTIDTSFSTEGNGNGGDADLITSEGWGLPPYISVHVRRRDFFIWCDKKFKKEECLAPVSAYARRVDEVKTELVERWHSPNLTPQQQERFARFKGMKKEDIVVLILSDEPRKTPEGNENYQPGESEKWWAEVEKLGWVSVDHEVEKTREKWGLWYEPILDACMLSLANGFVGTLASSYSLVARRRVEEWAQGPSRTVRWGNPGADDH